MNKILIFITSFTIAWICIIDAAVPITQLWVKSVECENLPLFDCQTRLRRISRSAQEMSGYFNVKLPLSDDIKIHLNLTYVDYTGRWKGFLLRNTENACSAALTVKTQIQKYAPSLEVKKCPFKPGNYTVGPKVINRYRKDWEADMQFWIPPYLMEADVWQVILTYRYKNDSNTRIGKLTAQFRLFNEFMSQ